MPTPPKAIRHEVKVSHNIFEELTSALNEAGIKLEKNDEYTVKPDIAIKGPILYRQVNLRHQILMEIVKIYKSPVNKDDMEYNDAKDFITFLDDVYQYILTGNIPASPENKNQSTTQPIKKAGW